MRIAAASFVVPGSLKAAVLSVALVLSPLAQPIEPAAALASSVDRVERVVDGDTIVTEGAGRVRLIGMNTPETVAPAQRQGAPSQCYGPEASAETKRLLPVGTRVRLETDEQETDKYGRRLVYVFREPDDTFINGKLVEEGFARARSYKPNTRYDPLLKEYQSEAKRLGRGLWGACDAPGSSQPKAVASAKPRTPRAEKTTLKNPGDSKNCADFGSYDEAKMWYDTYKPMYGDVAKLDADGDGIPCESLLSKERRGSVTAGST